ncbi:MAG TPA: alpha/beta hydrolase, partial [Acidimicrobiia bacterium]|nr:alpha/beta hydrolase [Acidimicrobiia bacterium]
ELVASAAVREPPVLALLEGTDDAEIASELGRIDQDLAVVASLIERDRRRDAAEHFIDRVALGPGSRAQLPEPFKAVLKGNAPTYLDELRDPTSTSVNLTALATTSVPLKITLGSESPRIFAAITDALAMLVPDARIETIAGAGHIPYVTHPHQWADILAAFHATVPTSGSRR